MRPESIPSLTEEQFKAVRKEIKRKPSRVDIARFERVKEILKNQQM